MDADTFNALALRVIAQEASADDRRVLETELASTPARREDFEQLRVTHDVLRATAPVALAALAAEPVLPAYRVGELRTAVRQHFGPASSRQTAPTSATARGAGWFHLLLRWVFGSAGAIGLGFAVFLVFFANRDVEFGSYAMGTVRGGDQTLSGTDLQGAKLVTFTGDAPFEQWQADPLSWNEHARVWIDHERDLVHIVRRVRLGQVSRETRPLAATPETQREQLRQIMAELQK